jgi:hypothetical protein
MLGIDPFNRTLVASLRHELGVQLIAWCNHGRSTRRIPSTDVRMYNDMRWSKARRLLANTDRFIDNTFQVNEFGTAEVAIYTESTESTTSAQTARRTEP